MVISLESFPNNIHSGSHRNEKAGPLFKMWNIKEDILEAVTTKQMSKS